MSKSRKMPPHPRAYGIDKKGEGAAKVRRQWRKWGKLDAQDQANEFLSSDGAKNPLKGLELPDEG